MRCVLAVLAVGGCLIPLPVLAQDATMPKASHLTPGPSALGQPLPLVGPALPGPVDGLSLGFGSSAQDVERILGKPTRVVCVTGGEKWFYGLSNVTLINKQMAGWCVYDRPLKVNIGLPKPGSGEVQVGWTAAQVVGTRGTPTTVASFGNFSVWYYGPKALTLESGRVTQKGIQPGGTSQLPPTGWVTTAPQNPAAASPSSTPSASRQAALLELQDMCSSRYGSPIVGFTPKEVTELVTKSPSSTADYWVYVAVSRSGGTTLVPFRGGKLQSAEFRALSEVLSRWPENTLSSSTHGPEAFLYLGGGSPADLRGAPTLSRALVDCAGGDLPGRLYLRFASETHQLVVSFTRDVSVPPEAVKLHPDWDY